VVGVIADTRTESLAEGTVPQIYLSLYQTRTNDLAIFVRGQLNSAAIPAQVRAQVQSVNSELPVFEAKTLDDVLSASLSQRRFALQMVGSFALTALLLAGLGIYGTISYLVGERRQEIGVRLALGATRGQILAMILRQGLTLATSGATVGLLGALIASRLMRGMLYGVSATDPLTFAGSILVLVVVALAGCYIPAMRATRVDPLFALRCD
jgi:ABC-type antimicrobial peptide transport system permease subunit